MDKNSKKKSAVVARKSFSASKLETEIIVEREASQSDHPYCDIPPYYFDRSKNPPDVRIRPLFSVETWDGRNVFTFGCNPEEDQ